MNEAQEKSETKSHKKRRAVFTACAVIVILGVAATAVYWGTAGRNSNGSDRYEAVKYIVDNAVKAYKSEHVGELPTINGTVNINGSEYSVVDICALLDTQIGMVWDIPASLWSGNGSNDDNCDGGCKGCLDTSHYILALDGNGSVYSTCVGDGCNAQNQDGYQGVWP